MESQSCRADGAERRPPNPLRVGSRGVTSARNHPSLILTLAKAFLYGAYGIINPGLQQFSGLCSRLVKNIPQFSALDILRFVLHRFHSDPCRFPQLCRYKTRTRKFYRERQNTVKIILLTLSTRTY